MHKDPKLAFVKRNAYKADFKLKAVSHAVDCGNRAAVREFKMHDMEAQEAGS